MGCGILTSNGSRENYNVVDWGTLSSIPLLGQSRIARAVAFHHGLASLTADAAVQLRRLAVLLDGQDAPILRLQTALEGQGETVRRLLASALAAVEIAGATT